MIPDGTVKILWGRSRLHSHYNIVSLKNALAMRKEFLVADFEVKIVIRKEGEWVTVSQTKGWET